MGFSLKQPENAEASFSKSLLKGKRQIISAFNICNRHHNLPKVESLSQVHNLLDDAHP